VESPSTEHHESHDGAYWRLFAALAVFTLVELAIPSMLPEPRWLMIVLLMAVAGAKAAGVLLYYMHVKFEKRLVAWIAIGPLLFVGILIMLIKADITEVDQGGWTFADAPAVEHEATGH
jgi:caa(3)-type oxidase subunit IV